ncbi:MAG TPA: hypothetical protein VFG42_23570 [Baekduia sp.]|uniref:hypothetical protein n=1 Tax=Baekduia sp. TaxID=2600305 RepID=UPI002D773C6E|nr:hypothetical protein [Baekduia sp.]HET6509793.1 hypothetical protein [Baekduia sp.]
MSRLSVRSTPAWLVAAVLAAIYLVVDPPSADLAAQTYRTGLFDRAGFVVFDLGWYGGHHNPAYSILFPPLASWFGPRLVGAAAAVATAWAYERLVGRATTAARVSALWFATATMVSLVTGRLTFALGLTLATLAVLALARERLAWCGIAGAAAALASPVAVAFLALPLAAWGVVTRRWVAAGALLAVSIAPAAALSLLFPEGGSFPFTPSAFWPTLAGTLLVIAVLWRPAPPMLRISLVLYALLLVVSGAISSPMGGNAARLGAILAGPLAALLLWDQRRRLLALVALPFLYWQLSAAVDDVRRASSDPSVRASFYDGLLGYLHAQQRVDGPFRIEIPFTDNHWESAHVAPTVPLARGWERQLDRKLNTLFYDDGAFSARAYEAWLHDNAVRYVALADAPIDYSAAKEAALVRTEPAFLREVWHDARWRVFAVVDPTPLASGGARVTRMAPDRLDLTVPRAGTYAVRVRFTPYWRVDGSGCVRPTDPADDASWTTVTARAAGPLRLRAGFSLDRVRATAERCSG